MTASAIPSNSARDSFLGVAGLVEAVARRQRRRRQRARQRPDRNRRHHALPARPQPRASSAKSSTSPPSPPGGAASPKRSDYVLDNLDFLVIKPAFPSQRHGTRLRRQTHSRTNAPSSSRRIEARPHDYAGQELLNLSTAPGLVRKRHSAPRRVVLRVYLAASGDSWIVMPGGLARVSPVARSPRRLHAARRRQQRHLGSLG